MKNMKKHIFPIFLASSLLMGVKKKITNPEL